MKHTWQKVEHKIDDSWPKLVGMWKCSVCGMTKSKYVAKNYTGVIYDRSGQVFSTNLPMPECIDWDLENSKTID